MLRLFKSAGPRRHSPHAHSNSHYVSINPLAPLQRCISPMSPCRSRSASPLQFPEPNHERTPSSTPQLQSRSQSPATPINQRIKQLTTPPRLEPNRRRAEYESMRRSTSSLRRSTPSLRRPTSTPRSLSASSADTNQSRSRSAVRDPSSDSEDSDDEEEEKKQDSDNEDKKPTTKKVNRPLINVHVAQPPVASEDVLLCCCATDVTS